MEVENPNIGVDKVAVTKPSAVAVKDLILIPLVLFTVNNSCWTLASPFAEEIISTSVIDPELSVALNATPSITFLDAESTHTKDGGV